MRLPEDMYEVVNLKRSRNSKKKKRNCENLNKGNYKGDQSEK